MSTLNYITNTPLPLNQDFEALKAMGLAYIQQNEGKDWTNFNPSDPGVTILEQICYALTELGYCNDFSVADILTDEKGELKIENQFYLPEQIFTTAPVTVNDYRKFIIDGVTGVTNVVITADASGSLYQVYIQPQQVNSDNMGCLTATGYYINKSRNIGKLFTEVKTLAPVTCLLSGSINVTDEKDADKMVADITNAIRDFIFPAVSAQGYDKLMKEGYEANDICDGPLLKNGWIPTTALGDKNDSLNIIDVVNVLGNEKYIKSIANLTFETDGQTYNSVSCNAQELIVIDIHQSVKNGILQIINNGNPITNNQLSTDVTETGVTVNNINRNTHNVLPKGNYRDINSYYSVQNTFPEIYAVGADAVTNNNSALQAAQSKQLKGYLTLFDQVLANQFSQLANVGQLFSFKNAVSGIPSQKNEFYAVKDAQQKANPQYPVPFLSFSPTYYYQALYNIPYIKPLLKNNDVFDFDNAPVTEQEKEARSWELYKNDPYNAYVWGLMQLIEHEEDNLHRRNKLLNHLLARHGESPEVIDIYIEGTQYSDNTEKDRVIIKSLYLQNLDILSYNRFKGYNFLAADKINEKISPVPGEFELNILGSYANDFIFNSAKIDRSEKISAADVVNYSGLELKLNLLFGLKMAYYNFLIETEDKATYTGLRETAYWLMIQRKGLVLIELPLLLNLLQFNLVITPDKNKGPYYKLKDDISYTDFIALNPDYDSFSIDVENLTLTSAGTAYALIPFNPGEQYNAYTTLSGSNYFFTAITALGTEITQRNIFEETLLIFLPGFVTNLNGVHFKNRLHSFLYNELPIDVPCSCNYISDAGLQLLIPAFATWHNSLIYNNNTCVKPSAAAGALLKQIDSLKPADNG